MNKPTGFRAHHEKGTPAWVSAGIVGALMVIALTLILSACSGPQSSRTGVDRCGKVFAHVETLTTVAGWVCALTGSAKCDRYVAAAETATGAAAELCP